MKASFSSKPERSRRRRRRKSGLNYNYWANRRLENCGHLSCCIQRSQMRKVLLPFFCIERNENCHHSRYPVQTSRSAIIYYHPLYVIVPFDKRQKLHPSTIGGGWAWADILYRHYLFHLIKERQWIFNSTQFFQSTPFVRITQMIFIDNGKLTLMIGFRGAV